MSIPNLDEYNRKKAKGLVSLSATDGKLFAIVTKKFNAEDGTPLDGEVSGVYLKEINDAIAVEQAKLDALKAFKADVLAAKVIVP